MKYAIVTNQGQSPALNLSRDVIRLAIRHADQPITSVITFNTDGTTTETPASRF